MALGQLITCNRQFSAMEILMRCIIKTENGCPAFGISHDLNPVVCSLVECQNLFSVEEIIKSIAIQNFSLLTSFSNLSSKARIECENDASLETLFNEAFTTGDNGKLIRTRDMGPSEITCNDIQECLDIPLEALLKKCFVTLNNDCTAIQVVYREVNDGFYYECGTAETLETLIRKMLIPMGDDSYSLSVVEL
jgi:hypothetical protein